MHSEFSHAEQNTMTGGAYIRFTPFGSVKMGGDAARYMRAETRYLLSLDADKLLYWFYRNAKLTPAASSGYGGWESTLIGGHFTGHYLTALAQGYAGGNASPKEKEALSERIRYVISALKACQDNAVKAGAKRGFLWGGNTLENPNVEFQFDNVEKNKTDLFTQAWVPWYTMHKLIAGLADIYRLTHDETALSVAKNLGDWTYGRIKGWDRATQNTVLNTEYGGMNDCLYTLYALTGEERYAVAAHVFDEEALFSRILSGEKDCLDDLHANTLVPKIIGALNRYIACHGKTVCGEKIDAERYLHVAKLFWEQVTKRHAYVTGGISEWERFGKDHVLNARRTNCNCETCIAYNLLKLTRSLFALTREKKYLDYYERTYINSILASRNGETGMKTYFQPMAAGYFKVYATPQNSFWCCTGTGMENFTKLGDSVYYEADGAIYVAMYTSSSYGSEQVSLTQTADLENSDEVIIAIERGGARLFLRRPDWTDAFAVTVGGQEVSAEEKDGFVCLTAKAGDEIKIRLKKRLKAQNLPDGEDTYAFVYGPYVLCADMGTTDMQTGETGVKVTVPAFAADARNEYAINTQASLREFMDEIALHAEQTEECSFRLACVGETLTYSPYYRCHGRRYAIYLKFKREEC